MSVDLEAIKARADKATPGPWEIGDGWVYTSPVYSDDQRLSSVLGMKYCADDRIAAEKQRAQRNAEFIAHAREDVPELLAEVERLRAALADIHRMARVFDTPRDVGRVMAFVSDVRGVAERCGGVS